MDIDHLTFLLRERAQNAIVLRGLSESLEVEQAKAEKRAIDAVGGDEKALGSNEAARKRALTIALDSDATYKAALKDLRHAEAERDHIAAEIEAEQEFARTERWQIRLRMVEALAERNIVAEERGRTGDDTSFDAVADEEITEDALNALPF